MASFHGAPPIQIQLSLPAKLKRSGFSLNVDLTLPGTGTTVIFGRSGSGKTTLLRCIAGLDRARSGTVIVDGEQWQTHSRFVPTHRRPLGMVFQEPSLFEHLNVKHNLLYGASRLPSPFERDYFDQVVQLLGLGTLLQRHNHELSGGERQRVAIGRALLRRPALLLMDEPLSSLDSTRKHEILNYLQSIPNQFATPILYITHSMEELARLASYVVVLDNGKVVRQGETSEVFSAQLPIDLGEEEGVVWQTREVRQDTDWQLSLLAFDGGEIWIPTPAAGSTPVERIRILARDVTLLETPYDQSSTLNQLPAEVVALTACPHEAMVMVRLKIGNHYLLSRLTKKSAMQMNLTPGKKLFALVKSVSILS